MNYTTIYVGPYYKFKKRPGEDADQYHDAFHRVAYKRVEDDTEFDHFIPYGEKAPIAWYTNHRECGVEHLEVSADSIAEHIAKFKVYAKRAIELQTEYYGYAPTFHFGVFTGEG